jgi:hypothetical protein
MNKIFHRESEYNDAEYGNYFAPHQNKDNRRAKRIAEFAKKKRKDEDEDYDT